MELPELKKTKTFLITPGNTGSFLIDLWNCHIIFFQYTPKKFQVLNPPACLGFFFVIAPIFILLLKLDFLDETRLSTRLFQKNFKQVGWWIYFSGNPPLEVFELRQVMQF